MRTETEMLRFNFLQTTATGWRCRHVWLTDKSNAKDEFQDYDVVYIVDNDNLDDLVTDLVWLDQFDKHYRAA